MARKGISAVSEVTGREQRVRLDKTRVKERELGPIKSGVLKAPNVPIVNPVHSNTGQILGESLGVVAKIGAAVILDRSKEAKKATDKATKKAEAEAQKNQDMLDKIQGFQDASALIQSERYQEFANAEYTTRAEAEDASRKYYDEILQQIKSNGPVSKPWLNAYLGSLSSSLDAQTTKNYNNAANIEDDGIKVDTNNAATMAQVAGALPSDIRDIFYTATVYKSKQEKSKAYLDWVESNYKRVRGDMSFEEMEAYLNEYTKISSPDGIIGDLSKLKSNQDSITLLYEEIESDKVKASKAARAQGTEAWTDLNNTYIYDKVMSTADYNQFVDAGVSGKYITLEAGNLKKVKYADNLSEKNFKRKQAEVLASTVPNSQEAKSAWLKNRQDLGMNLYNNCMNHSQGNPAECKIKTEKTMEKVLKNYEDSKVEPDNLHQTLRENTNLSPEQTKKASEIIAQDFLKDPGIIDLNNKYNDGYEKGGNESIAIKGQMEETLAPHLKKWLDLASNGDSASEVVMLAIGDTLTLKGKPPSSYAVGSIIFNKLNETTEGRRLLSNVPTQAKALYSVMRIIDANTPYSSSFSSNETLSTAIKLFEEGALTNAPSFDSEMAIKNGTNRKDPSSSEWLSIKASIPPNMYSVINTMYGIHRQMVSSEDAIKQTLAFAKTLTGQHFTLSNGTPIFISADSGINMQKGLSFQKRFVTEILMRISNTNLFEDRFTPVTGKKSENGYNARTTDPYTEKTVPFFNGKGEWEKTQNFTFKDLVFKDGQATLHGSSFAIPIPIAILGEFEGRGGKNDSELRAIYDRRLEDQKHKLAALTGANPRTIKDEDVFAFGRNTVAMIEDHFGKDGKSLYLSKTDINKSMVWGTTTYDICDSMTNACTSSFLNNKGTNIYYEDPSNLGTSLGPDRNQDVVRIRVLPGGAASVSIANRTVIVQGAY